LASLWISVLNTVHVVHFCNSLLFTDKQTNRQTEAPFIIIGFKCEVRGLMSVVSDSVGSHPLYAVRSTGTPSEITVQLVRTNYCCAIKF
jgi:hypothetical protein